MQTISLFDNDEVLILSYSDILHFSLTQAPILSMMLYSILAMALYSILAMKLYSFLSMTLYFILAMTLYYIMSMTLYSILVLTLYSILAMTLYSILSVMLFSILAVTLYSILAMTMQFLLSYDDVALDLLAQTSFSYDSVVIFFYKNRLLVRLLRHSYFLAVTSSFFRYCDIADLAMSITSSLSYDVVFFRNCNLIFFSISRERSHEKKQE